MSVNEILMRPGNGSVRLVDTAPLELTKALYDLVVGVGCHVVIMPQPLDPNTVSDATMLSQALYTGRVVARPDRLSLEFTGISTWLDSYNETAITRTSGTPTNWVDDVIINNITRGTVSGGSNVTATYPANAQTRRQILDDVAKLGSWEYEFRPNFTVNAGTSVFVTSPTVVITAKDEGPDGTYTGLLGGLVDQAVDASNVTTKVIALGQGAGSSIVTGSATKTPNLKTQNGSTPTIVQVVNAPNASTTNAGTVATVVNTAANVSTAVSVSSVIAASSGSMASSVATVSTGATRGGTVAAPSSDTGPTIFQRPVPQAPGGGTPIDSPRNPEIVDPGGFADVPLQRAIEAATRAANEYASSALAMVRTSSTINSPAAESQFIRRVVRPGDSVYLYDLESGLFDTSTQITYRGETIFPLTKRVLSMTWAIEQGYGVYVRSNASTPAWYDLTPHVEWEAPGATLEVGDRPADSFPGVVNRSNPDIETRVTNPGRTDWTPTITQVGTPTFTLNRGWTTKRDDGTFEALFDVTFTSAGTAGNDIIITSPFTLAAASDCIGEFTFRDASVPTTYAGTVVSVSTTALRLQTTNVNGFIGTAPNLAIANGDGLRLRITGTY